MRRTFEIKIMFPLRRSVGFTLVEAIVVIAVIGVIAAGVAVFIRGPIEGYVDATARAALADTAETALKRISRDLQTALPNSVRVTNTGGAFYLEFLQTRTGGRYRAEAASPAVASSANTCPDTNGNAIADEDVMTFGVADTCFRSLGDIPDLGLIVPNSDYLVIYNLGTGYTGANAYAIGPPSNKSLITAVDPSVINENRITFAANNFTLDSPGHRFQVVSGPVSYVCDPTVGTVRRYDNYGIATAQPTGGALTGNPSSLLAESLSACTVTYDVINSRVGVVNIWLQFATANGGTVNLYNQVLVDNVP
jgi:MSHA biogenesis protein MshO